MHEITLLPPGAVWTDSADEKIQAHGGGILYYSGRYYWFGENRYVDPQDGRKVAGVSCYSSVDLVTWDNHGVVLPTVPVVGHDLHHHRVVERPKVLYNARTDRFVMVLHIDSPDYRDARVGFAVSDSPTGPYLYYGSVRPNQSESRDMTVFQDEDGEAYLFYASEGNATMHVTRLLPDYLGVSDRYVSILESQFREAPAVFKRGRQYYLVTSGCTGWRPNAAQWATADSIWGPWRVRGNPCQGTGAETTFGAQGTYILQVHGAEDCYVFMADVWNPKYLAESRYVWLPVTFADDSEMRIAWSGEITR